MTILHDGDKRSAFPFSRARLHDAAMSSNAWVLSQEADLHLRGVRARVTWPPATSAERPPLLVQVRAPGEAADPDLYRELAVHVPAVVLAVEAGAARETLEWGADHAAELGADASRIVLGGSHRGATAIAALAREARERGWPPIAHIVLFDPGATALDALPGLFRAAVGRQQAARPGGRRAPAVDDSGRRG
jgi:hypothetical protein